MVGCASILNIDVTGGRRSVPVCWESKAGLAAMAVASSLLPKTADADNGGCGISPAGVGGIEPISLDVGVSASLFSSSSRIAPSTLRTMLPTVSSLGAASTSFLPTSCTLVISFPGSGARVVETTFLSSHAVAKAQGLGPRTCRRRRRETRCSIDFSTGHDGKLDLNNTRPGAGGRSIAMVFANYDLLNSTDWVGANEIVYELVGVFVVHLTT